MPGSKAEKLPDHALPDKDHPHSNLKSRPKARVSRAPRLEDTAEGKREPVREKPQVCLSRTIVCNPSYGNNPYIRTTEMALKLSDKLGGGVSVVVPHVYGEKQRRILEENFGNDPRIILDEEFGAMLRSICFEGSSYTDFLKQWIDSIDGISKKAAAHLKETYDIVCEVSRSPLLDLDIKPAFYNSWSRTSDIMELAMKEPEITLDPTLLLDAAKKFQKLESHYALHLISVPGTLDPKKGDEAIPLSASVPPIDDEGVKPGIYVTVSGIPDVGSLQTIADRTGLKIYASDSSKIKGSTHALPGILARPEITAHVARAGWGAIGTSLATETPIIVPEYKAGEDPEIFFNIRRIEELGLGIAFKNQTKDVLLKEIVALRPRIADYKHELMKRFGTLDGAEIAAEKMMEHLA